MNFTITWAMTKRAQGDLYLRIDDIDQLRTRTEYIDDIRETLKWLGFDWNKELPLQSIQREKYWSWLQQIPHYVCDCSRKQIEERGVDAYDGFCRLRNLTDSPGMTQIRLLSDDVRDDMVLWRKEDNASYQLASVVDDISAGVNLIVRGEDLRESTNLQKKLVLKMGLQGISFKHIKFFHHPLLTRQDGQKLSKSNHDISLKSLRENGHTSESVFAELGRQLGINNKTLRLDDFLEIEFEKLKGLEIDPTPSKN